MFFVIYPPPFCCFAATFPSLRCLLSAASLPPFRCFAATFPLLCCHLSAASPPPFCRFRGSDPLLPASLRSVAHRVRPHPLPPRVRSGKRCDRGSDPSVPELATEGLTQCRAPLHKTPVVHRSDRRLLSAASLPPFCCFAATFPPLRRHLSVASGGQTRCCQPRFARWHIGSDPFPLSPFPSYPPSFPLTPLRCPGVVFSFHRHQSGRSDNKGRLCKRLRLRWGDN